MFGVFNTFIFIDNMLSIPTENKSTSAVVCSNQNQLHFINAHAMKVFGCQMVCYMSGFKGKSRLLSVVFDSMPQMLLLQLNLNLENSFQKELLKQL